MHYVGIVKTQWFNAWIQTKALRGETSKNKVQRELDDIHIYLEAVCSLAYNCCVRHLN